MAITNREIIQNQLRRINEKMKTDFVVKVVDGRYRICKDVNGKDIPPYPLKSYFVYHNTADSMMDYLAGLEDAIDTMPKKVYFVKCECNDQGWNSGYHHFTKLEDAIKLMRNYVARQLWYARREGNKIFIKTFRDSVMNSLGKEESQTIFVRIDEDTFEYRVWSEDLRYAELPKDMCFNY